MAFEADCRASTVLEAIRVADTARPLVPRECQGSLGVSRPLQPGLLHHKVGPEHLWCTRLACSGRDGKPEIRNPKSEIPWCALPAFLIPNS